MRSGDDREGILYLRAECPVNSPAFMATKSPLAEVHELLIDTQALFASLKLLSRDKPDHHAALSNVGLYQSIDKGSDASAFSLWYPV